MMFGELFAQAANFILGICVMLGAAYVFQRSRRAALFIALGGLAYALAVPFEILLGRMGYTVMPGVAMQALFFFIGVTRHLVFFGGIVLGMRTLAREAA